MSCRFPCLLLVLALALPGSARADEDDPTVLGKKVSEWRDILKKDKDARKRRAALFALDRAGYKVLYFFRDVGAVLKSDSDPAVRRTAAQVLGNQAPKAVQMPVKTPIKEALEALIHALEKDPVAEVRETAAMALGKIGPDAQSAIPALAAALKHTDLAVRVAAAESLGLMGTQARTVVTDMVQAYRDNKDVKVRQALTVSFGRLGDGAGAAVGVLSEALTSEINWDDETALEFRRVTAEALGLIGKAEAVEPLARFLTQALKLERPSESVLRLQRTLMSALTQEPLLKQLDKAVLPVLKDATASRQDKYVRCQAAFALGRLGRFFGDKAREYVGILKDGINDNLNDYRLVSIQALGEVGKEVIGDQLNEVGEKLRIVASSAGQKGLRDAADATLKQLGLK